jgi:hypothetical protein
METNGNTLETANTPQSMVFRPTTIRQLRLGSIPRRPIESFLSYVEHEETPEAINSSPSTSFPNTRPAPAQQSALHGMLITPTATLQKTLHTVP